MLFFKANDVILFFGLLLYKIIKSFKDTSSILAITLLVFYFITPYKETLKCVLLKNESSMHMQWYIYIILFVCSVWNSDHKNHSRDKDKTSDISNYKSRALTSSAEEDNLKDRDSNK